MEMTIQKTIHVLRESVDYAVACVNRIDIKKAYQETYSPYFLKLEKYRHACQNEIRFTKHEQDYFRYFSSYPCCLAQLLLYTFAPLHEINSFDCQDVLLKSFHQYDLSDFPCFFPYANGLNLENKTQPFMKSVQDLNLSDEEKLRVIYAFYNYEESINELLTTLKRIYDESIVSFYQKEMNELMMFYTNETDKQQFQQYIESFSHEQSIDSLIIYPMLCNFDSYIMYKDNAGRTYLLLGLGRTIQYFDYLNSDTNSVEIVDFLNVLSDPTKLTILRNIKHNARYGNELAQILNLKTSTISYHMDVLCKLHLVNMNKVGKRVYYSLNKAEINRLLDMIKEIL